MNLEEAQILANLSTSLANSVQVGILSREEAKGILKLFLPKRENAKNISDFTQHSAGRVENKPKVTTATDVK